MLSLSAQLFQPQIYEGMNCNPAGCKGFGFLSFPRQVLGILFFQGNLTSLLTEMQVSPKPPGGKDEKTLPGETP